MKLAILFWFYKDAELCRNRLRLLRRHNPATPIYGLYGGPAREAEQFRARLAPYLDDFYAFPDGKSDKWKWFNGDLMIAEWYGSRGRELAWDTVVVVQWDMLVVGPVAEVFADLKEGEILLSDVRAVGDAPGWLWTTEEPEAARYRSFVEHVHARHGYAEEPLCCQFVVVGLPRQFLERYREVEEPELGFIEYRVPTYARLFGTPFCRTDSFRCWWPNEPATRGVAYNDITLTAARVPISFKTVRRNLRRRGGARVFHPFYRFFPLDPASGAKLLAELLKARAEKFRPGTLVGKLSTALGAGARR